MCETCPYLSSTSTFFGTFRAEHYGPWQHGAGPQLFNNIDLELGFGSCDINTDFLRWCETFADQVIRDNEYLVCGVPHSRKVWVIEYYSFRRFSR